MEKYKVFFSADNQGLSSTQANTIANWCKEMYQNIDTELENIQFYNKKVKLLDSTASAYQLENGITSLDRLNNLLTKKSKLQSLIAWLREALKAKEAILKELRGLDIEDLAKIVGVELPESPVKQHILTEDEYIASLSIKERNRYYWLETLCAVYGQFVHPKGAYSEARKNLSKRLQKPNEVSGNGKDTIITTYTPTIPLEDVDDKFFELQQTHRGYEAELNGMKHKMELAIDASRDESTQKYNKEYSEWSQEYQKVANQCNKWLEEQVTSARDLKIIIPNDLQPIFDEVSKLGKEGKL